MSRWFAALAEGASAAMGSPLAFAAAVAVNLASLACEPLLGFRLWNIWYNNLASITMLLGVILLQYEQNRGTTITLVKLDELLRMQGRTRAELLRAEDLPERRVDQLEEEYRRVGGEARQRGR